MEEEESRSRLRRERARWSRSIAEKFRVRMEDFSRDYVLENQFVLFSEVVNKHICGSTGELAEDCRDVTKVWVAWAARSAWPELSTGEFVEALRFVV